jgi:hypothetical protein
MGPEVAPLHGACAGCGTPREPGDALAWAFEPGEPPRYLCPACARGHVRDIEAKLAPEWWDPRA